MEITTETVQPNTPTTGGYLLIVLAGLISVAFISFWVWVIYKLVTKL